MDDTDYSSHRYFAKPHGILYFHRGKCLCQCFKQYQFFHTSFFPTEPTSCHRSWTFFCNVLLQWGHGYIIHHWLMEIGEKHARKHFREEFLHGLKKESENEIEKEEREIHIPSPFLWLILYEDRLHGFAAAILQPWGEGKSHREAEPQFCPRN